MTEHTPDPTARQPIRISSPTDILDLVPALMGFYPTESLCVLYFGTNDNRGGRLALTSRLDLPTTEDDLARVFVHIADQLTRYPQAILVAYSIDQDEARTAVAAVATVFGPDHITTGVIASPHGWTTVDPQNPHAIQWTNTYPTGTTPAAAAIAAAGLYAAGTREDLRDLIATPDDDTAAAFHAALATQNVPHDPSADDVVRMAAEIREVVSNYVAQPYTIDTDDAAFLVSRIQHAEPRDAALLEVEYRTGKLHATLWQGVAAMTPDAYAEHALGLTALTSWIAGDGALANLAIERAAAAGHDTRSHLLGIAADVLTRTMQPTEWDEIRRYILDQM